MDLSIRGFRNISLADKIRSFSPDGMVYGSGEYAMSKEGIIHGN